MFMFVEHDMHHGIIFGTISSFLSYWKFTHSVSYIIWEYKDYRNCLIMPCLFMSIVARSPPVSDAINSAA